MKNDQKLLFDEVWQDELKMGACEKDKYKRVRLFTGKLKSLICAENERFIGYENYW